MLAVQAEANAAAANAMNPLSPQNIVGSGLTFLSDERVKRDVIRVGQINGFNIYHFHYIWSNDEYVGVIAQEVERARPDAVTRGADGFLRVHYDKIGIEFRRLNSNEKRRPRNRRSIHRKQIRANQPARGLLGRPPAACG